MDFLSGILYQFRGLKLALRSPKLLLLGLSRLIAVILLMVALTGLILYYHSAILNLLWSRPESVWLVWLWYLVSWMVTLLLIGFSGIFAYLIAQILFSVLIMDLMSRITESMITGPGDGVEKDAFFPSLFLSDSSGNPAGRFAGGCLTGSHNIRLADALRPCIDRYIIGPGRHLSGLGQYGSPPRQTS